MKDDSNFLFKIYTADSPSSPNDIALRCFGLVVHPQQSVMVRLKSTLSVDHTLAHPLTSSLKETFMKSTKSAKTP